MKPAEIATAVVSIPVVAAFLVTAMTMPAQPVAPAPVAAIEAPVVTTLTVADEIVVVAKRNVANGSS